MCTTRGPSAPCAARTKAHVPSWTVHHCLKPDLRITVTDPDLGTEVRWRTNGLGLRGPEVEVPKPPGTFRIVCLGDESTLRRNTQAETFAARLKELLPVTSQVALEVINAGCPQTGPLLSYLSLRHRLLALAPDLVVFNFDMADVADDHRCRRHVRMNGKQPLYCPHPELERQRTASEVFWVERLLLWQHGKRGVGHLLGAEDQAEDVRDIDAPQGAYAWLRDDAPDWSVYIDQTLDVLGQMAVACRQANAEFVLSVIPCPWQVTAEASNGAGVRERAGLQPHVLYKNRLPFDSLSAFAERENILYCDPSPAFRGTEHAERLFRENAPRFSAAGHDLYARVLNASSSQTSPDRGGPTGAGPIAGCLPAIRRTCDAPTWDEPPCDNPRSDEPMPATTGSRSRRPNSINRVPKQSRRLGERLRPTDPRCRPVVNTAQRIADV